MHCASARGAERFRTPGVPGAGASTIDPAAPFCSRGRGRHFDENDRGVGSEVWALRLSEDRCVVAASGLEGEPQESGADLATRGFKGATETAEARAVVVE